MIRTGQGQEQPKTKHTTFKFNHCAIREWQCSVLPYFSAMLHYAACFAGVKRKVRGKVSRRIRHRNLRPMETTSLLVQWMLTGSVTLSCSVWSDVPCHFFAGENPVHFQFGLPFVSCVWAESWSFTCCMYLGHSAAQQKSRAAWQVVQQRALTMGFQTKLCRRSWNWTV